MTVEDIVDDLLKNMTYSPEHQEIREHIVQALNNEYDKILEKNGYADLLSIAELIQSYGTLEQAGRLAGYSQEEIESWTKEGITKYSDFRKQHLISRFHILFSSFLFPIDLAFLFNTFYFGVFFYLIPIVLTLPYLILYGIKYKKWIIKESRFSCEIYHKIEFLSSQYFKKMMNSSLLGIFAVAMGISVIFLTNYRGSELFSQIFSSLIVFEILFFCIFKNIGYTIYYHFIIRNSKEKLFYKHLLYVLCAAGGYWLVTVPIIALVSNTAGIILAICFSIIYFGLGLFYILKFRKDITMINLRVNKKRIVFLGTLAIIALIYQSMRLDSWLLQPYINQISTVEIPHSEITYNDQSGVYTIQTQEEDFKILQLTDIHLGGSNFSYNKDKKALFSVFTLIEYTKPDLVIVTGDLVFPLGIMSFSFNNSAPIMQFASFMRNIGVPWAFTYGNHDTESLAILTEDAVDSLFRTLSFKRSRNLLYPYIQPNIYGRNNQIIEIRGKENQLIQALFLLDSNSYIDTGVNNYDYIHDDQVEWY
ncbi:MAG: metallophosphoesterase, partial [Anaeroplasmataceae bacterium]|nr:metallophosphoesterase [Anaeroplasmataceae bacterium]